MEIQYTGEHLLIGEIGNLFVLMAFVFGLLATLSFALATNARSENWKRLGRASFIVHAVSVIGIVGTLFTMLLNQYFEYHYVWQHSNSEMPFRYIFSSFWEGQEGSFLLWLFWHVVLGSVLLFTSGRWQAPVMAVFSSVQVFLTSMLLGVYIFEYKLGSNPFTVLLREHPDFANLPLFQHADYLDHLDGRGLNPLLQNYWMTIHPPTLFLGFASTLVPFAYAIAGLWKKEYLGWVRPALPWTFFGIAVLGIGILMGGAWAYEALSFGGFWAWDPVENASLVPWLTMVGGGHLMLIQRRKGASVFSLFFFTLITFVLILYSTFLTRSGVLGDSSVHAFTDLGMSGQLLIYLLAYFFLSVFLLVFRYREFPSHGKEESVWSREFWMFLGSLVLFIAAFQIIFSTSFPVINKVFGTNLAPSSDVIEYYNRWQIPMAVIVCLLMGAIHFLKYERTQPAKFFKSLALGTGLALAFTIAIAVLMGIVNPFILALLFASLFAVTGNTDYWLRVVKGKSRWAGPALAHAGFGLLICGALVSTSQSEVISQNTSLFDISALGENYDNQENILLMKDDTLQMGEYFVAYRGREREGINVKYQVDYYQLGKQGTLEDAFTLYPFVQLNPRMGNAAEPDTRHFLHKDVYTHVTYAEIEDKKEDEGESSEHKLQLGDTLFAKNSFLVLQSLNRQPDTTGTNLKQEDLVLGATFEVYDFQAKQFTLEPIFVIRDQRFSFSVPDSLPHAGIEILFTGIDPETESFDFDLKETDVNEREFIVMKAIIFPGINILWMGCILMGLGSIISVVHRVRMQRKHEK